ncbi:hypothetical protein D5F01_LYC12051 [Larimichthys crocea]|uniref:Uncharacterized protein n=1 Tax=Larimichthys crocea TaxID=215358 RepID=A0A6G0IFP2_LARCR|nr:hypothetical protein D5F01_LYC12051 [Larimichthys crocea]
MDFNGHAADFYLSYLEEQVRSELGDSTAKITQTTQGRVSIDIQEDLLEEFLNELHAPKAGCEMTDKPTENSDQDSVSLKSNGRTPTNGATKQTLGMIQTLRKSIRRAAEKSPLSPGGKGSKVTPKTNTPGDDSSSQPPPSPSLSSGSPSTSPLKNIRGFFQKKEEDDADVPSQKSEGLKRSKTDPNIGATLLQRGADIRRSLRFGTKKDKDKNGKQDSLIPVAEHVLEEKEEEKEEEEVVWEEVEEAYTLPEMPHTPLSVMQINNLIQMEVLEEAHLNLLALRLEFNQERENAAGSRGPYYPGGGEESRGTRRPSEQLEGGLEGGGGEGVQVKVEKVHLEPREQNASWLAVHLGLLGKTIVEDLENVKKALRSSYPPSFKVFSTYVKSYHTSSGST